MFPLCDLLSQTGICGHSPWGAFIFYQCPHFSCWGSPQSLGHTCTITVDRVFCCLPDQEAGTPAGKSGRGLGRKARNAPQSFLTTLNCHITSDFWALTVTRFHGWDKIDSAVAQQNLCWGTHSTGFLTLLRCGCGQQSRDVRVAGPPKGLSPAPACQPSASMILTTTVHPCAASSRRLTMLLPLPGLQMALVILPRPAAP